MGDLYDSYAELAAAETYGVDYDFQSTIVTNASYAAIAIHGGGIERGSGDVAVAVAADLMDYYEFRGLKSSGNFDLHITSTLFDEPTALTLIGGNRRCFSMHGFVGTAGVAVTAIGGLDTVLVDRVTAALTAAGFTVSSAPDEINGDDPANICNQTSTSAGVQLEMSSALRDSFFFGGASAAASDSGLRTEDFYRYVAAIRSAYIGYGLVSVDTVNSSRWTTTAVQLRDTAVSATVSTDVLATGGSHFFHVAARFQDTSNFYSARLEFTTAAAVNLTIRKRIAGTETAIGSTYITGFTHTAGGRFGVELWIYGNTLRARAWEDGNDPGGWNITTTDTALTAAGQIGTRSILSASNTNTLPVVYRVGDVQVTSPDGSEYMPRYDLATCTTNTAYGPTETTLVLDITSDDEEWSQTATYDLMVSGELIGVPIGGMGAKSAGQQTLTGAVRSKNGVLKTLPAGSAVRVAIPGRWAL